MSDLIHWLDRLNRKERFFLVGWALGNGEFQPSTTFLAQIAKVAKVSFPDPSQIHCWIDYHLDWLYVALTLSSEQADAPAIHSSPNFPAAAADRVPFNVNQNQEDVDLLLAFDQGDTTHLVMVEAKGVTGWTFKQMSSKAKRLDHIFKNQPDTVVPHFVLTSPRRSKGLDKKMTDHVPEWMLGNDGKLAWLMLPMPDDRTTIERVDDLTDSPSRSGKRWRVKN